VTNLTSKRHRRRRFQRTMRWVTTTYRLFRSTTRRRISFGRWSSTCCIRIWAWTGARWRWMGFIWLVVRYLIGEMGMWVCTCIETGRGGYIWNWLTTLWVDGFPRGFGVFKEGGPFSWNGGPGALFTSFKCITYQKLNSPCACEEYFLPTSQPVTTSPNPRHLSTHYF